MKKVCYYQGCGKQASTREHIPPKAFFPDDQRDQLLTVASCSEHNNGKASDDIYVLAHICMNASPANGARDVLLARVAPQVKYNNGALSKRLAMGAVDLPGQGVAYKIDITRFDGFFSALSFGIVYKACGAPLPRNYRARHIYHHFANAGSNPLEQLLIAGMDEFYAPGALADFQFGSVGTRNTKIYAVKMFGLPDFQTSITVIHEFFGKFKVTSMLSRTQTWA